MYRDVKYLYKIQLLNDLAPGKIGGKILKVRYRVPVWTSDSFEASVVSGGAIVTK